MCPGGPVLLARGAATGEDTGDGGGGVAASAAECAARRRRAPWPPRRAALEQLARPPRQGGHAGEEPVAVGRRGRRAVLRPRLQGRGHGARDGVGALRQIQVERREVGLARAVRDAALRWMSDAVTASTLVL